MHEIGHAFDQLASVRVMITKNPLHAQTDMIAACTAEKSQLRTYFHDPAEFVAEVFARYCLDRERAKKKFPKAVAVFDSAVKRLEILANPESTSLVDAKILDDATRMMLPPPPVVSNPDAWEVLNHNNILNNNHEDDGRERDKIVMGLITERNDTTSARMLARDLSRRLFYQRSNRSRSTFGIEDAFKEIDLNDKAVKENVLNKNFDHHAFVVLIAAQGLTATTVGMIDLLDFLVKARDICVPIFHGSRDELEELDKAVPELDFLEFCKIDLPTPEAITRQVSESITG